MGIRGPAGKREEDRLGHAHAAAGVNPVTKVGFEATLVPPEPNPAWVPIAQSAYQAFLDSPLSAYYAQTDLVYGWMSAEAIHQAVVKPSPTKTLAAESMMRSALFNEADRRRIRIELTRKEPEVDPVVKDNVAQFRQRRQSG